MSSRGKKNQLYEVEIKSQAILDDGKKSFITYFRGGTHEQIISNCRILYPKFMHPDNKPYVEITPISLGEYRNRVKKPVIEKKGMMNEGGGHFNEIMGNQGPSA